MAHFAQIDENNIVLRVCVVDDAHEARLDRDWETILFSSICA